MLELRNVIDGLSAMRLAGLNDYGRWPSDGAGLSAMGKIWLQRLNANKVTPSEFNERLGYVIDHSKDFPSIAEFLAGIERKYWVIDDPVLVDEGDGTERLGSRSNAIASGLPFREIRDNSPVLPVTPEQRAKSLETLESKVVEKARKRRVKAADIVAQDKRIQNLPGPSEEARRRLQEQIKDARK